MVSPAQKRKELIAKAVEEAQSGGLTDDQILQGLASTDSTLAQEIGNARTSGLGADELVFFLRTGERFDRSAGTGLGGAGVNILRSATQGAADFIGGAAENFGLFPSPADVVAQGVNLIPGIELPKPSQTVAETVRGIPSQIGEATTGDPRSLSVRPEQLPPSMRPAGRFGQVIGESIFPAGAMQGVAVGLVKSGVKSGGGRLSGALFRQMEWMRNNPRKAVAAEISSMIGGAEGAAFAEFIFPDSDAIRIASEVIGSVASPRTLLTKSVVGSGKGVRKAASAFSLRQREKVVGDYLQTVISEFGEDPVVIVEALRKADRMGLTAGTKMALKNIDSSDSLLAIENRLAQQNIPFDRTVQKRLQEGQAILHNAIRDLRKTGRPSDLASAARLQSQRLSRLVDGRVSEAAQNVAIKRAEVASADPASAFRFSKEAEEILARSLDQSRQIETTLYNKVPKSVLALRVNPTNTVAKLREFSDPGVGQDVLPEVQNILKDLTQKTSIDEYIKGRSSLLEKAKTLRSEGKVNQARQVGELAQAMLDDVGNVSAPPGQLATLQDAMTFSRELNDAYTRTFAFDVRGTDRTGARSIAPEAVLFSSLEGASGRGGVATRELQEATRFTDDAVTKYIDDLNLTQTNFTPELFRTQQEFLSALAARTIDDTGKIDQQALRTLVTDPQSGFSGVFDQFPDLKARLLDAAESEDILKKALERRQQLTSARIKSRGLGVLLQTESPAAAIGEIVASKQPSKDFNKLFQFANRRGKGAVNGLRVSVFDHAIAQAKDANGDMSFVSLNAALKNATKPGGKSLMQMMRENNMITDSQLRGVNLILREGQRLERRAQLGTQLSQNIIDTPGGLQDMLTRIAGAKLATFGTAASGRAESLIAAAAGSRFLRQLLQNVPQNKAQDLLIEAFENPKMLADIIEMGEPIGEQALGFTKRLQTDAGMRNFFKSIGREAGKVARNVNEEARFLSLNSVMVQAGLTGPGEFLGVNEVPTVGEENR